MRKIKFLATFTLVCLLTITSCSEDNTALSTDSQENIIESFSINNLNQKKSDELYIIENIISTDNDINLQLEGLVITVDSDNKKGYFTKDNEAGSIPFNLIIKDESSQVFEIQLVENKDSKSFAKLPIWLCATRCVLNGFAMSLLDGPAPIMDIAAAFYVVACSGDC